MTSRAQKLLDEAKQYLTSADKKQAAADSDKWAAAERMWKARTEEDVALNEVATAVGVAVDTARLHITIWERHGGSTSRPSFAAAVYEVKPSTAPAQNQANTTKRTLREADDKTVEQIVASLPPERLAVVARAAIEHAPHEVAADARVRHAIDEATPAEERAERTQRALRDPAVARHVVRDDSARSAMAHAAKEMEKESTQRQRERAPGLVSTSDFYEFIGRISEGRRAAMKALDAIRRVTLDDERRDEAREHEERARNVLDWIRSYIDSGDHSFDEELDRLLREEA